MKKCHKCGGIVKKVVASATLEGITINNVVFGQFQSCREHDFEDRTSLLIQEVLKFMKQLKPKLMRE